MNFPSDISSCHELLELQQTQLRDLGAQNVLLLARIAELESRLNKNSSNSNKPPSSDGLGKKPKRKAAFDRKKGRRRGGQKGHKGKTLEISSSPDHLHELLPSSCGCGRILDKSQAEVLEIRQVVDLPEPKLEVHEYRKLGCSCPSCGADHVGTFPQDVPARIQYGLGVRALVVMLNVCFKLPYKKIQCLFADLYGYSINQATMASANQRCYENLAASEGVIKQSLLDSLVSHFDETGLRVEAKLHWLHTCSNGLFTYLFVHAKRGMKALESAESLLKDFTHRAIHDCWKSYFKFTNCLHGLCGAHLIRELVALEEKDIPWASWFKRYLFTLYHLSEKGTSALTKVQQAKALKLFDTIWTYADQIEPQPTKKVPKARGRPKATKGRNLLTRLKQHQDEVLAFAFHKEVPFTNNQAERDLRPAKTKQKIAGSFRALQGAKVYARIQGFASTVRKHNRSVFSELKNAFSGQTFLTLNS